MANIIKAILKKEKNKVRESIYGQLDKIITVISIKIKDKVLECINGLMVEFIKDNGDQIEWMD